jgi:hypothetical protein
VTIASLQEQRPPARRVGGVCPLLQGTVVGSPPDADRQGFVGYPGARCNYTNPAVVIGRTADSAMVIRCDPWPNRFPLNQPRSVANGRRIGGRWLTFRKEAPWRGM